MNKCSSFAFHWSAALTSLSTVSHFAIFICWMSVSDCSQHPSPFNSRNGPVARELELTHTSNSSLLTHYMPHMGSSCCTLVTMSMIIFPVVGVGYFIIRTGCNHCSFSFNESSRNTKPSTNSILPIFRILKIVFCMSQLHVPLVFHPNASNKGCPVPLPEYLDIVLQSFWFIAR